MYDIIDFTSLLFIHFIPITLCQMTYQHTKPSWQNQISNSEKDTLHALELCYVDKHPLYDIFSLQATNIAFVNVVRNVVELTTINYNIIIKVSL